MNQLMRRLFTVLLLIGLACGVCRGTACAYDAGRVFQTDTSDTDKVTASNKNALLIADAARRPPPRLPERLQRF